MKNDVHLPDDRCGISDNPVKWNENNTRKKAGAPPGASLLRTVVEWLRRTDTSFMGMHNTATRNRQTHTHSSSVIDAIQSGVVY